MIVVFTSEEKTRIQRAQTLMPREVDVEEQPEYDDLPPAKVEAWRLLEGLWYGLLASRILVQDDQSGRYYVWNREALSNIHTEKP